MNECAVCGALVSEEHRGNCHFGWHGPKCPHKMNKDDEMPPLSWEPGCRCRPCKEARDKWMEWDRKDSMKDLRNVE
jgi:hypothetical protein